MTNPSANTETAWHESGPAAGDWWGQLVELWSARELAWVFAERDLKVRYRQAVIGVAWVCLQPLALLGVFLLLFRGMGQLPIVAGHPPLLMLLVGLLIWQFFATTVRDATTCLVGQRDLVTKVYFPRLLLPISTLLGAAVDLAIGAALLPPILWFLGVLPGWPILTLPLFLIPAVLTALGVGIWLAALNALYRDIGYAVPFLLQLGMFVTPVIYETAAVVPESGRWLLPGNPLFLAIDGCRWALLPPGVGTPPTVAQCVASCLIAGLLLLGGVAYFRRIEAWLADRI